MTLFTGEAPIEILLECVGCCPTYVIMHKGQRLNHLRGILRKKWAALT